MATTKTFFCPTKIIHGAGSSALVADELVSRGLSRVLLVTDQGVRQAGVTKPVEEALAAKGIEFTVFADVEVDPSIECVQRGAALIAEQQCQAVVIVGGGSPLCAGKGMALVAANGGNIKDYAGPNKAKVLPLPVLALPTTAGSGSEVSPNFLIKDYATHAKMAFVGRYHPVVAILDPLLLLNLPYWQAVCSSLDALSHAVEALFTNEATPATDALALHAVKMMVEHLFPAAATASVESREQMLLASALANLACGNAGLGLVHAATYGLWELPHGYACGLMLPFVMEFNLPAAVAKMADLAVALGSTVPGHDKWAQARDALARLQSLYRELNFPSRLDEAKAPRASLAERVEAAFRTRMIALNIRRAGRDDLTRLFERAYAGWGQ